MDNMIKRPKGQKRKRTVATGLMAAAAALFAFTALIRPALTMENPTYCGYESHAYHTEDCYQPSNLCSVTGLAGFAGEAVVLCQEEEVFIEESEEGEDVQAGHIHGDGCFHTHSEECFGSVLVCEKSLHVHDSDCYSNPEADVESQAQWEATLANISWSDNIGEDIAAVAASQAGYRESSQNYRADAQGILQGWSRYGSWAGDAYMEWSSAFAGFCLKYGGQALNDSYYASDLSSWVKSLDNQDELLEVEDIQEGDIIFSDEDDDGTIDHAEVVTEVKSNSITTVTGDLDGKAEKRSRSKSEDSWVSLYRADKEEKEEVEDEEVVVEEESEDSVSAEAKNAGLSKLYIPYSLQVSGVVSLDDEEPGDERFTFELYNKSNMNTPIATAENDDEGNVVFDDVRIFQPGMYFYEVKEAAGEDEDIEYDDSTYDVSLRLTAGDMLNTYASAYWTVLDTADGSYFISDIQGETAFQVYCLDRGAKRPTNPASDTEYSILVNPTTAELENVLLINRWGDNVDYKMKQLFYYMDTHPEVGASENAPVGSELYEDARKCIVWEFIYSTGMYDKEGSPKDNFLMSYIDDVVVPDDYDLYVFVPKNYVKTDMSRYQTLAGGHYVDVTITDDEGVEVEQPKFVNRRKTLSNVDSSQDASGVTITAKKLVNGEAPGDKTFKFNLFDSENKIIDTAKNDADGNIVFKPITYTEAGTYTYVIKEVNDHQPGVTYDENEYKVTVTVNARDVMSLDTGTYYSVLDNTDHGYYMSDTNGLSTFPVYCVDRTAKAPTSPPSGIEYDVIVNPDSATLASYLQKNRWGDDLAEKMKKLFYYLETHPEAGATAYATVGTEAYAANRKGIVWEFVEPYTYYYDDATWPYNNFAFAYSESVEVPEGYDLVLFVPKNFDKNASTRYQPLAGLRGPTMTTVLEGTATEAVFKNTYEEVVIPDPTYDDYSFSITAKKTVNGEAPGDKTFSFNLYESNDLTKAIATAKNDKDGNITFPAITYSKAGTYTYVIKEVNDGQEGVEYDDRSYSVTVTITEQELMSLNQNEYYSVENPDNYKYFVSDAKGANTFEVYCLDFDALSPSYPAGSTKYSVVVNPSNSTLETLVPNNRWGDNLASQMKKLFYYLDTHPEAGERSDAPVGSEGYVVNRKNIVWEFIEPFSGSYEADTPYVYNNFTFGYLDEIEVPDNYDLVIFVPENYVNTANSRYQTLGGGRGSVTTTVLDGQQTEVVFENKVTETKPDVTYDTYSFSITAKKTLNGEAPGDKTFNFNLYNADDLNTIVATAQNDAEGNIVFPAIQYTQPGTYTYVIKEQNDMEDGIEYDTRSYTVTVVVTARELLTMNADAYYSVLNNGDSGYYVSDVKGESTFQVYCIDYDAIAPSNPGSNVKYTVLVNPTTAQLEQYTQKNRWGDDYAEYMKRLFYYLDTHPDAGQGTFTTVDQATYAANRKSIVWEFIDPITYGYEDTSMVWNHFTMSYLDDVVVPDGYDLVVFVPEGYNKDDKPRYQTLAGGRGPVTTTVLEGKQTDAVFENTSKAPEGVQLPDTGGSGTAWFTGMGLLITAAAVLVSTATLRSERGKGRP